MKSVKKIQKLEIKHGDKNKHEHLEETRKHGFTLAFLNPISTVTGGSLLWVAHQLGETAPWYLQLPIALALVMCAAGWFCGILTGPVYFGTWLGQKKLAKLPHSEKKKHVLWHDWLRSFRYESTIELNALISEFNMHLDNLQIDGARAGEQEQRAYDAIMEYRTHVFRESQRINLILKNKDVPKANVARTTEAIDRLTEATGGRAHSDGNKITAALEAEHPNWSVSSMLGSKTTDRDTDKRNKSRAALAQAKQRAL